MFRTPFLKREWGFLLIALESTEEKPVAKSKNVRRGEGIVRLNLGSYFNNTWFFHIWSVSMRSWFSQGGSNPYSHIWILTMKRIYAEGLEQRTWKEIGIAGRGR